jgi:flagellar motor switch protein FliG
MEAPPGSDAALLLLRLLPAELTRRVLACLPAGETKQFEALLSANQTSLSPEVEARALRAFFELEQAAPSTSPPSSASNALPPPDEPGREPTLLDIEPALLARALEAEQPAAIAMVLGQLEPAAAADVAKRLPAAQRNEVMVKMCQPGASNAYVLAERLTRAVVEKARRLSEVPVAPSNDARVRSLAAVVRRLGRAERTEVLAAIEHADPAIVDRIRSEMFGFDDLLALGDRALQTLLVSVDLKTLALALKGASNAIAEKVLRNTSNRTRAALSEEISLLSNAPKTAVQEAQDRLAALLRTQEEEGKISFDA